MHRRPPKTECTQHLTGAAHASDLIGMYHSRFFSASVNFFAFSFFCDPLHHVRRCQDRWDKAELLLPSSDLLLLLNMSAHHQNMFHSPTRVSGRVVVNWSARQIQLRNLSCSLQSSPLFYTFTLEPDELCFTKMTVCFDSCPGIWHCSATSSLSP